MKVSIEVNNRQEAIALRAAMADPQTKAFALIIGSLLALKSDSARRRVLQFVFDKVTDPTERT